MNRRRGVAALPVFPGGGRGDPPVRSCGEDHHHGAGADLVPAIAALAVSLLPGRGASVVARGAGPGAAATQRRGAPQVRPAPLAPSLHRARRLLGADSPLHRAVLSLAGEGDRSG